MSNHITMSRAALHAAFGYRAGLVTSDAAFGSRRDEHRDHLADRRSEQEARR